MQLIKYLGFEIWDFDFEFDKPHTKKSLHHNITFNNKPQTLNAEPLNCINKILLRLIKNNQSHQEEHNRNDQRIEKP